MKKLKGDVQKCPHCGYDEFYVRATVSGTTSIFYRFDGQDGDNTHMWDYVTTTEKKTAFCGNCQKRLGTIQEDL
ncbi:hypothetical protein AB4F40_004461 [Salmonella enterica]|uniref:hypothetical protein n=1 Tax=Citrobacter sp. XY323 TaxID=2976537 RepID=UPI002181FDC7|nr:hypothetical protein [Citrobacter sp. XY323]EAT0477620.1 hypothetical protein [Salmonella enterica]EBG8282925.1 hypothetical protein [Salmonella enterica subsp. enterica serovar Muenchen]ELK8463423.1 hypothetical protein [Salmonella enterica]MCS8554264.1 hypothetical protein [Citrobacter sp. XY323]